MNGWAMETFAPKIRINDFHSQEFWFRVNDFHPPEFGFGLTYSVAQGFNPGFKKERSPKTRAFTPFCQKPGFVKGIKKEAALVRQPLFNHLNKKSIY